MHYIEKFKAFDPTHSRQRLLEFLEDLNADQWEDLITDLLKPSVELWSFLGDRDEEDLLLEFSIYIELLSPKYILFIAEVIYRVFKKEKDTERLLRLIRFSELTKAYLPESFVQRSFRQGHYTEKLIHKMLMAYSQKQRDDNQIDRFWIDHWKTLSKSRLYFEPLFLTTCIKQPFSALTLISSRSEFNRDLLWPHIFQAVESLDSLEIKRIEEMDLPSNILELVNQRKNKLVEEQTVTNPTHYTYAWEIIREAQTAPQEFSHFLETEVGIIYDN